MRAPGRGVSVAVMVMGDGAAGGDGAGGLGWVDRAFRRTWSRCPCIMAADVGGVLSYTFGRQFGEGGEEPCVDGVGEGRQGGGAEGTV